MKALKPLLILSVLFILASCAERTVNHITTFPQEIDKETGLREIKLRRSDCINTPYEHIDSRCSLNEEVQVDTNQNGEKNVDVNERTPWVDSIGESTVANPRIQIDEKNETILVKVEYREFNQTSLNYDQSEYTFSGNLNEYRKKWTLTKNPYLYLYKKTGGEDFVKSMLYCSDAPICHEMYVLFSFITIDEKGEKKLGSRYFNIDQRELPLESTDFIPGKAKQSLSDIVSEPIDLPEIIKTPGEDSNQSKNENSNEALPSPETQTTKNDEKIELIESEEEQNQSGTERIYLIDDEADPEAAALFDNVGHPVLPKDEQDHLCQGFKNNECPSDIFSPEEEDERENYLEAMDIVGMLPEVPTLGSEEPQNTNEEVEKTDEESKSDLILESSKRPQARPTQTQGSGITILEEGPIEETNEESAAPKEEEAESSSVKLPENPVVRPRPRPDNLVTSPSQSQTVETGNVRESTLEHRYMKSLDEKFRYDFALCEEELVKLRNEDFHQAKYFYAKTGKLKNADYFQAAHHNIKLNEWDKNDRYASGMSALVVNFSACVLKQRYKNLAELEVHDFSLKHGGKIGKHSSHQNGLDVDIGYPHFVGQDDPWDDFRKEKDPERIELAIDYARILMATDRVHILFTLNSIKRKFCNHLKTIGKFNEFQEFIEKSMYHISGHDDHYHVRMTCNSQNYECIYQNKLQRTSCE